ncbi:putative transcriptional regulatory protein, GntR family, with putative PLP-dependent aminotransferase domain [Bradyrhizobium sp. ORS 285]|uniref:aminotransferase-like domain-containing protein n=1 Tax=Bradyrhizobium sp. ORS 285 TaxID=115808 RepID=UPI0002406280|nr:PLP-dependent aminotransferase family protein [Bradyrhizobium sp. ORS 285]CCD89498.1 putative transcriptional regulatory protein, GntR family, with PLP-dependent aminotransferase domain [Bradyrhizobium sp. ORS 285]SMX58746.1 putative transcriptional regulatory protein, GntR family, with putative PLP-dependent aminotransferase domain [Bradyrhizobium sp. ORS 285]
MDRRTPALPLYEALADSVTALVDDGVLRAGMRALSVRSFAAQHGVSLTTALQTYRLLEDRGVLEARPKSGFYIMARPHQQRPLPTASQPPLRATQVSVSNPVFSVLSYASDFSYAPLGCAIPSAGLLAAERLDRHLARCARVHGRRYNLYADPHGDAELRVQISERALRLGHAVAPEGVLITNGCTEALNIALSVTTRHGDTVAIESPTYFGLLQVLEARGLRALELPTDPVNGIDVAALDRVLGARRVSACLLASSFNNPLGYRTGDKRKAEITKVLTRHGVPLIEDDIYGDISFGEERPRPFAAISPKADIILCSSFSKTIAPGYRIGWLAANHRHDQILAAKFALSLSGAALPQKAMADFLGSGGYDAHLRRIRKVFAGNVDRIRRVVDRSFPTATRMTNPQGGFVLWLELPKGFDSDALYARAIRERICFVPGGLFTASGGYRNCLRLSCSHDWDARIERSVARLGELAHELLA